MTQHTDSTRYKHCTVNYKLGYILNVTAGMQGKDLNHKEVIAIATNSTVGLRFQGLVINLLHHVLG
jgi:hypothetical protein